MQITWVTRSLLDYRISLFSAIAAIPGVDFLLITSGEDHATPLMVREKIKSALGERVVFLHGEHCIGKKYTPQQQSNSVRRIFWQPGLRKEILKNRPDVVITDAFNHWTLPVLWLRSHHSFKHLLCYERTTHTERTAPWLKRKFISFVQRWVDGVQCNGSLCRDFLLTLGYPAKKLHLGNLTADIPTLIRQSKLVSENEILDEKKEKNIQEGELVFLYIGALIPRKGIREFLQGWTKWHNGKNARLLLVGKGVQEYELKKICQNHHLNDVSFCGPCQYEQITRYHAISDVFVIPTLEDNWSLVVPEAMAGGLPVMTSVYNGCYPELVTKGNGWIFDPLSEESIIETLDSVWNQREALEQMGDVSRQVVGQFSPQKIAKAFYDSCISLLADKE